MLALASAILRSAAATSGRCSNTLAGSAASLNSGGLGNFATRSLELLNNWRNSNSARPVIATRLFIERSHCACCSNKVLLPSAALAVVNATSPGARKPASPAIAANRADSTRESVSARIICT